MPHAELIIFNNSFWKCANFGSANKLGWLNPVNSLSTSDPLTKMANFVGKVKPNKWLDLGPSLQLSH